MNAIPGKDRLDTQIDPRAFVNLIWPHFDHFIRPALKRERAL
jgi:hypothetical protein